jgi:hypothetical protein
MYDVNGKMIGDASIDFCSDCKEIWPKLTHHPSKAETYDRPFGEGTFQVWSKEGDYSDCCNAEVSRLDFATHVEWICDTAIYINKFDTWDEGLEARAVFSFDTPFGYGLVHDWFGFEAVLELSRTDKVVTNLHARLNNRLFEWVSDVLEEMCEYENGNKDSTTFMLRFDAEQKTMTVNWKL